MDAAGDINVREALVSHARVLNELRQDVAQIRMEMVRQRRNLNLSAPGPHGKDKGPGLPCHELASGPTSSGLS
ncbi:Uncharacterized protein DAT39_022499 [Clarias magur]|uniref:Uncharacterized protein n=1 Tax=Clarias magur TaxID=1594786 RepID=A0A8J4T2H5_CLAMG|nr:Uncharacterized protein DAT39_022499 [Clarias magur]